MSQVHVLSSKCEKMRELLHLASLCEHELAAMQDHASVGKGPNCAVRAIDCSCTWQPSQPLGSSATFSSSSREPGASLEGILEHRHVQTSGLSFA